MTDPSRRALLGGALALAAGAGSAALIQDGVLPGRAGAWRLLDAIGAATVPDVAPGPVLAGTFSSAAMRREVGWLLLVPPGTTTGPTTGAGGRLPVVIALHGRGGDERTCLSLGLDRFLAASRAAGMTPFAIGSVAGGDTYWHPRRSGVDASAMIVEEFLPLLADRGLAARPQDRIGLLGWSMGGYGALRLAGVLGAGRVAAVVAQSPALWLHPGQAAAGAFDDAADFARNDVFVDRDRLHGVGVRVDCGLGDPFVTAVRRYAAGLHPAPAGSFGLGGHDDDYWRRLAPAALATLGGALSEG